MEFSSGRVRVDSSKQAVVDTARRFTQELLKAMRYRIKPTLAWRSCVADFRAISQHSGVTARLCAIVRGGRTFNLLFALVLAFSTTTASTSRKTGLLQASCRPSA